MELKSLALPYLDRDALAQRFAPLSTQPWAILLDSAAPTHPDSGFSLFSAAPLSRLVASGEAVFKDDKPLAGTSPLAALKAEMAAWPVVESDLPFATGALGAFAYDLGRSIEKLPTLAEADLALPDMAVGFYDWAVLSDHDRQQSWLISLDDPFARLAWLERQSAEPSGDFALAGPWQANMTRAQYGEKFRQVQHYLHSGDCYQINLAQRFKAPYQGDEWQAYLTLRAANAAPFSAFMRLEDGCLLSISPERFLRVTGQQVQTKPIKGTLPRDPDPAKDAANAERLRHSPKDRAENVMIVDLLRNDLGRVAAPGSVKVPALFDIESFPAVHHLVSTVTCTLAEGNSAVDLLAAAFPGGSITGAPKVRAMEIIEELEPNRRSFYCGSVGFLSANGNMDTSIAIRTLVAWQGHLYCWAGGGLVADSDEAAEYQETLDKVSRILPLL
ncbi:aminodeoxychorismate synthase subunit I [Gallaecimonas xiamenensis 3-C-1]|uniref:aminodeoxychorismate synthase n=2 Tax=Gallaecimonas TaxID=745410 RepID=K2KD88_9GAMM|nr:aminodeoxychorismate synthase component 1 [Gallaecimonas xiamenensis]EKE75240.1 aminodeoxychorismate synthase subunit I [Gallaecimonas xiamenensis 3-C-1]